jgi:acyl-CoA synthetase (AMP-forming)/AMP-acid ligase II
LGIRQILQSQPSCQPPAELPEQTKNVSPLLIWQRCQISKFLQECRDYEDCSDRRRTAGTRQDSELMPEPLNIADRLRTSAGLVPDQPAVVFPACRDRRGRTAWTQISFAKLDAEVDQLARGLISLGVRPGHRLVLMVRPSIEFISLVFAVFRTGAVCVLIDPGMGRSSLLKCLDETDPDGFIAIPLVHLIRSLMPWRFRRSQLNVNVGPSVLLPWLESLEALLQRGLAASALPLPQTMSTDPAAVIFTSGSTGPPKGVVFEHGMFNAQVDLIRSFYRIAPGETDLPGFPLFALFNLAMQVTTVIPEMDPTRPADADPLKILAGIDTQRATQAYGSPAMWNRVGRYCEQTGIRIERLNRVLSAGAPVPLHVVRRMTALLRPDADIHTPYGATECLPVASIGGREILAETATQSAAGRGTCVGSVFPGVEVRIIRSTAAIIPDISAAEQLPDGEIGEIIVRSPAAARQYFRRPEATAAARIPDGSTFWHRMGDVGFLDEQQRLWFCGRLAHVVHTPHGPMYSVCCEAIFDQHPQIYRSALTGEGPAGHERPLIIVEPEPGQFPESPQSAEKLRAELLDLAAGNPLTAAIKRVLFHRSFPVDTRHNVKINREQLRLWAAGQP